jgi:hypothetical protein
MVAIAAMVLLAAAPAWAANQYLADGVKQNPATGAWVLPDKGTCYPVEGAAITTRPECVATIFPTYTTSSTCATAARGTFNATANVCVDNVNNTALTCVDSAPSAAWPQGIDRKWSGGACLLTMKGYNRQKVTCANQGGTYGPIGTVIPAYSAGACQGAWIMPDGPTFTPPLLTSTGASPGPGDQCLRCHRTDTQWNVNQVRLVEMYTSTGHRNMARKVTAGTPQIGPDGTAYPTDSTGAVFNWTAGTVAGNVLYWIYDGWFESPNLPASVAAVPAASGKAGVSYSCGRCHTTGWTSDAVIGPSTGGFAKEPEKSFPGITWDGVTGHATNGQVNLAGGVAGDTNPAASWDLFGITCDRCHGAVAANNVTGTLPYSAPTGYSTHNNGMTGTSGNGYCSIPGPTASAQCTAIGGTWLTTACSDGIQITQAACLAAGKTWTFATCTANNPASTTGTVGGVKQAYCSTPDATKTTSAACAAVIGGSWTDQTSIYTTSGACTAAGFTWLSSKCQVCYTPNASYATGPACAAVNISPLSTTWTNAYATDADSCIDAGGKWADTKSNRGQVITSLCMQCHRQETSGLPNTNGTCTVGGKTTNGACVAAGGTWTETGNGLPVTVGPYHNTVTFPSHFHGNQYLNSPHGKFTGKFPAIATAPFGYGGPDVYQSFFITEGEIAGAGNGCTGCHNVHKSTDPVANPAGGSVKECTECHAKNLAFINHPSGVGTPLEKPAEACASCHMPAGEHFFRINVDKNYTTFPMPAAIAANTDANTSPDGAFTKAVWVDLDASCGQCHGGGSVNVKTTGTVATASAVLTVASSSGFVPNEKIRITGAGAYYYNSGAAHHDLDTYVKSVDSPTQITLAGAAPFGVTNAAVVQNAVSNNASWFSRTTLQGYATGIHNDKPTALFTASYGANGSTVVTDASASTCSGSNANCAAYDWNFGDGSAHGSGVSATHTYVTPGAYTITLSVTQYGFQPGVATRVFNAYATVNRPVAAGTCSVNYTTWIASCSNTTSGTMQVASINWGDGSVVSNVTGLGSGPFTHTYLLPNNATIKLAVVDPSGQSASATIGSVTGASFQFYSITGSVTQNDGVTPIVSAQIQYLQGGVVKRSVTTGATGTFNTGNMKPGTYSVKVSRMGYTFANPPNVTIGPSVTGQLYKAN